MDAFAEFELDGPLGDEPDEHDTAQVIKIDDPVWVLVDSIRGNLAISRDRVKQQLRAGRLEGALVYCADGDRDVPGRRWAIRRDALADMCTRYDNFTLRQACQVLGVSVDAARRLTDTGLLPPKRLAMNVHPFYLRADVAELLGQFLTLVLTAMPAEAATSTAIHSRVKRRGSDPAEGEVRVSKVLHPRSTQYWLSILASAGVVSERRGWFRVADGAPEDLAAVAAEHVWSVPSALCGRDRKSLPSVRKRPRPK
jgi:hypothetical protein